jgi:hypothetical protein
MQYGGASLGSIYGLPGKISGLVRQGVREGGRVNAAGYRARNDDFRHDY